MFYTFERPGVSSCEVERSEVTSVFPYTSMLREDQVHVSSHELH